MSRTDIGLPSHTTASDRTMLRQATDESNEVTSYAPPSIAALGGAAGALSTRGGDVVRRRALQR